jgi:hypothetical protein
MMRVVGLRTSSERFIGVRRSKSGRSSTRRLRNVREFAVKEVSIHGFVQMS